MLQNLLVTLRFFFLDYHTCHNQFFFTRPNIFIFLKILKKKKPNKIKKMFTSQAGPKMRLEGKAACRETGD